MGPYLNIIAVFDTAAKHLRFPKVRVQTTDGAQVGMQRCGNASKYTGAVNVYIGRTWLSRINRDGTLSYPTTQGVRDALTAFNADPVKAATDFGKLTGRCCFCGLDLTDARSITKGYGPVCADHYGLPWGEVEVPCADAHPITA